MITKTNLKNLIQYSEEVGINIGRTEGLVWARIRQQVLFRQINKLLIRSQRICLVCQNPN